MRERVFLAALFLLGAAAPAPPKNGNELGQVARGVVLVLNADGTMDLELQPEIVLYDGTRVVRDDKGKWTLVTDRSDKVPFVDGIDLVSDPDKYIGHRVRIRGGNIRNASATSGSLELRGGDVYMDFHGMDPMNIKALIIECSGIMTGRPCKHDIIADVAKSFTGGAELQNPILADDTSSRHQ